MSLGLYNLYHYQTALYFPFLIMLKPLKSHQTLRPPDNRWDTATSPIQQYASNAPSHRSLVSDLQLLAGFGKLRRHLPAKIFPINYGVKGKAETCSWAFSLTWQLAAGSCNMRCRKIGKNVALGKKIKLSN